MKYTHDSVSNLCFLNNSIERKQFWQKAIAIFSAQKQCLLALFQIIYDFQEVRTSRWISNHKLNFDEENTFNVSYPNQMWT